MSGCKHCGRTKAETEFYESIQTYCKEHWRERVRQNRMENVEYYREFDRMRANRPDRVAAREEYAKSERGRARHNATAKSWSNRNPQKRAAHVIVGNAIRDGRLVRQPCEVCGNEKSEAHHDDYSKPLDVKWLCTRHHVERHKQLDS